MTRYVLIGGGVASVAAIEGIRSVDTDGPITLICNDPDGYYSRPGLAYLLTGEIDEKQLYPFQSQDFKKLNFQLQVGEARRIFPADKIVKTDPTADITYDQLLIATGATAKRLDIPGADQKGVFKLDHLEDARQIIRGAGRVRTAVVTGGGITALELAEGLIAQRVKVHYVMRGKRFWSNVLDDREANMIETRLIDAGVILHYQREVVEILGKNGQVSGVRLDKGEPIVCEMVAYAIGIVPRSSLAREAGIDCDRGILVNESLQTNFLNIYAAGDIAQIYDPRAGKFTLDSLWSSARAQGYAAGQNMAGKAVVYRKPVSFNVTRLGGITITIIGAVGFNEVPGPIEIVRGDSETWRQVPSAVVAKHDSPEQHLRLMVGENIFLGAVVIGAPQLSAPLLELIRDQIDITQIRDQLLAPNASIEKIIVNFHASNHF